MGGAEAMGGSAARRAAIAPRGMAGVEGQWRVIGGMGRSLAGRQTRLSSVTSAALSVPSSSGEEGVVAQSISTDQLRPIGGVLQLLSPSTVAL